MIEIVSPPLTFDEKGESALKNVMNNVIPCKDVYKDDAKLEYWNNENTSNHIHLSCMDIPKNINYIAIPSNLVKVCLAWWYFEPVFFHMCDSSRRDNKFCIPLRKILLSRLDRNRLGRNFTRYELFFIGLTETDFSSLENVVKFFQGVTYNDRYAALNLHNLITT